MNRIDKVNEIIKEFEDDLRLTMFNLEETTMLSPTYVSKWIGIYAKYKYDLETKQNTFTKMRENEDAVIRKALKVDASDNDIAKLRMKYGKELNDIQDDIDDYKEYVRVLGELKQAVSFYRNDVRNALQFRSIEYGN